MKIYLMIIKINIIRENQLSTLQKLIVMNVFRYKVRSICECLIGHMKKFSIEKAAIPNAVRMCR